MPVKTRSAAVTLALALALSACGREADNTSAATPAPSSSTSTTVDEEAERAAVLAAYRAELDAFYAASNPPNPDHPDLPKYATGRLLAATRKKLAQQAGDGIGARIGEQSRSQPVVLSVGTRNALVGDCVIDADIQFDLATGEVIDDAVVFGRITARLVRSNGTWLVEHMSTEVLEEPCDL